MRTREPDATPRTTRDRADTTTSMRTASTQHTTSHHAQSPPSETSFTLGGSAVWVGDESGLDLAGGEAGSSRDGQSVLSGSSQTLVGSSITSPGRKRRSTGASVTSVFPNGNALRSHPAVAMAAATKDTHYYHTTVQYKDHQLPIKMPLFTFPEEVGDVSRPRRLCSARTSLLMPSDVVLSHHPRQTLPLTYARIWTTPPAPSYEWTRNSSHHHTLQRSRHRQENNFPWPQETCGRGLYLRARCLRSG